MKHNERFHLTLFGPFSLTGPSGVEIHVSAAKHRALIAILATAAKGKHTRRWLQEVLWSLSGEELGRASLRRALSDLRGIMGNHFETLFTVTNTEIRIDREALQMPGNRESGEFLEGIKLHEPRFKAWTCHGLMPLL